MLENEVFLNDPGKQSETDDEDEMSVKSLVGNNVCIFYTVSYASVYVATYVSAIIIVIISMDSINNLLTFAACIATK